MDNNVFDRSTNYKDTVNRPQIMNKKLIVILLLIIAVLAGIFLANSCSGVKPDGTTVEFEIAEGSSAKTIANSLKDAGLIKSSGSFLRALKKSAYANSLKFGVYEIEKGMSNDEIILLLSKGGNLKNSVTVTIPEGYSLERIKALLIEKGLTDDGEFERAVSADYDYSFLKEIPEKDGVKYRLQGFLFPSTYQFSKDMTAEEMIKMMLKEFERQIEKENISKSNLYETITLAALVEREAKLDDERARIAGVIKNRIEKGMRLQIDASVVYAISDGMYNIDRVLYRDLEIDSPYNTYKYSGLPIGPICSPGIEAIKAAANPEKHSYYYYRTDNEKADGSHIFTESFEEHKAVGN